jgi:ketosteroid isomerase-like protein
MSRENVEIVRGVFETFQAGMERGDPGAAFDTEALVADAEWLPAPGFAGSAVCRGREGFVEFMRTWTEDFEDWSIRVERLIDAGNDRVVALLHQWATGKGSGVPVEVHSALIYELEGGRVVRMRNYLSHADALEAAELEE